MVDDNVKKIEDQGWYCSMPASIVRSSHFQEMAKRMSISQLLTETDAPFLSPFPGKKNQPAFVIEAVKKIAELKNLDIQETANVVFMNYQKLI